VPLKYVLIVIHVTIRQIMYDFLLVCYCKYSSILYLFRVIWRSRISQPENLCYGSLKGNWKLHHSLDRIRVHWPSTVCGPILYRFLDTARSLSRIAEFFITHTHLTPPLWRHRRNFAIIFRTRKLKWWDNQKVKQSLRICLLASIQHMNVSDGQTNGQRPAALCTPVARGWQEGALPPKPHVLPPP